MKSIIFVTFVAIMVMNSLILVLESVLFIAGILVIGISVNLLIGTPLMCTGIDVIIILIIFI